MALGPGKALRREIPLAERDEWETLLAARRAEHGRLTGRIVALETELNDRVYRLLDLTPNEIPGGRAPASRDGGYRLPK